jgi:hypothetical protein
MVFNFTRIWGADGQYVPFSGGPDTLVGNPNECFLPTSALPFLAPVVRVVRESAGLAAFLTNSVEWIQGGPSTASFFSTTLCPGVGLLSYNALDVIGGEIYFFSPDLKFQVITPQLQLSDIGWNIGDQFANTPVSGISDTTWDASKVYVACHRNGLDNCVFVADGLTGWYRLNPSQVGAAITTSNAAVWSPFASITNGCQMVVSVETTPGIKNLLVGGTAGGLNIAERSLTVWTDQGAPYNAGCVMGVLSLAPSGAIAVVKFLEAEFNGFQNSTSTLSYLINEIPGSLAPDFTLFSMSPISDPPSLYGNAGSPQSFSPNRWYMSSTGSLARCRYISFGISFGTSPNPDTLLSLSLFGRVLVEA